MTTAVNVYWCLCQCLLVFMTMSKLVPFIAMFACHSNMRLSWLYRLKFIIKVVSKKLPQEKSNHKIVVEIWMSQSEESNSSITVDNHNLNLLNLLESMWSTMWGQIWLPLSKNGQNAAQQMLSKQWWILPELLQRTLVSFLLLQIFEDRMYNDMVSFTHTS